MTELFVPAILALDMMSILSHVRTRCPQSCVGAGRVFINPAIFVVGVRPSRGG